MHVGGSGIADGTGVLGQYQVGLGLLQHGGVDMKRAFTGGEQGTHGGLYLGATEHRGVNATAADHRFVSGCRRIVTQVTDPDQLVPEAQGKHDLRPTGE